MRRERLLRVPQITVFCRIGWNLIEICWHRSTGNPSALSRVAIVWSLYRLRGEVVDMSTNRNAPPKTGWAKFVTELHVAELGASLAFWKDIIGFEIAFEREEEKFVYLEHPEGQQIMLCQRHGRFETGPMQLPLGQGAMFQIYLTDISSVLANLSAQNWPIYLGPRQVWRRTGDRETGQEEVFVQDPDGYLLMLARKIGERGLAKAD